MAKAQQSNKSRPSWPVEWEVILLRCLYRYAASGNATTITKLCWPVITCDIKFASSLLPGDEEIKLVQVQFLDIAWFLKRCRPKFNDKMKLTKKLDSRVAVCRVSVDTPLSSKLGPEVHQKLQKLLIKCRNGITYPMTSVSLRSNEPVNATTNLIILTRAVSIAQPEETSK